MSATVSGLCALCISSTCSGRIALQVSFNHCPRYSSSLQNCNFFADLVSFLVSSVNNWSALAGQWSLILLLSLRSLVSAYCLRRGFHSLCPNAWKYSSSIYKEQDKKLAIYWKSYCKLFFWSSWLGTHYPFLPSPSCFSRHLQNHSCWGPPMFCGEPPVCCCFCANLPLGQLRLMCHCCRHIQHCTWSPLSFCLGPYLTASELYSESCFFPSLFIFLSVGRFLSFLLLPHTCRRNRLGWGHHLRLYLGLYTAVVSGLGKLSWNSFLLTPSHAVPVSLTHFLWNSFMCFMTYLPSSILKYVTVCLDPSLCETLSFCIPYLGSIWSKGRTVYSHSLHCCFLKYATHLARMSFISTIASL